MASKYTLLAIVSTALLTVFCASVNADDTDIYVNNSTTNGGPPLVMFSLDYRSNLGSTVCTGTSCDAFVSKYGLASTPATRFELLREVLKVVLVDIKEMQVGLMINHSNDNNCAGPSDSGCSNGGYMLRGFKPIVTDATYVSDPSEYASEKANKDAFHAALAALPTPSGDSHSYQGKELYFEFFRYLTGQSAYNAHLGFKDFENNSASTNLDDFLPAAQRDMSIESDSDSSYDTPGVYTSPLSENCSKIFTINFLFQVSNQEDDSDAAIKQTKANGGMQGINLSGNNNKFSTVLDWLHNIDLGDGSWGDAPNVHGKQNVTSFFVVEPTKINTTTNGYAMAGGTTAPYAWSDNPEQLVETLSSIFRQILSVSTTFTAASVPISVLNRAQIIDNVYIALFKADSLNRKSWPGNLKKLKIDLTNSTLVDRSGNNAVAIDGRIKNDSLTFWTDENTLPAADPDNDEVDGKDGRSVQRGGAGQIIPGYRSGSPGSLNSDTGARKLFYQPSSGTTLPALNANSTTATALQSDLAAADSTEALTLLKYARGLDVLDEDLDTVTNEARQWILGDPLHSRPLPINYGARSGYSTTNPDIRIVMGSNDGFFHMFKNTTTGGSDLGEESWAFMPRAVMQNIKVLKANASGSPHPYGVDGPPSVYFKDANNDGIINSADGDKVWVFFGLRRGGHNYYALDVTNPDSPSFMWSITNSGDFSELGFTFSQPRVEMLKWDSNDPKPVIIVGGGYDVNKDATGVGTDDSEGNAIFVIDAQTGALVWKAVATASTGTQLVNSALVDSIPSTITTLDTSGNGLVDRAYVGDTGGVVWRVDFDGTSRGDWKLSKLASVGRHYNNSHANDRRFFHRPDFVKFKDGTGPYDAVIIGSGDRAHPTELTVDNWFYMIKDRGINIGDVPSDVVEHNDLGDITSDCLQNNSCSGSGPNLSSGWRLQLEAEGEKNLATPTTLARRIFFTTYIPPGSSASSTCEPSEGTGRLYAVSLSNGTAVNDYAVSNGTDLGKVDRYVDLDSGGIPSEVVYIPFNKILRPDLSIEEVDTFGRWKTYWYKFEN